MPAAPMSQRYTLAQRAALLTVPPFAALVIGAIGCTLRFEDLLEPGAEIQQPGSSGIFCFWHQCTLLAGWRFRSYHPHVLISRSFDGELIARTLGLLGYRTIRGSSSSGAVAGLLGLRAIVRQGRLASFTADGPRGPLHVAKAGPVKLAQATGTPIGSFHLEPEHAWTLGSWDQFLIPKPFSRVVVAWARKLHPPKPGASEEAMEAVRSALDAALERARANAREALTSRRSPAR